MLDYKDLTKENYRHLEPLVMASEEVFPENIRETSEAYFEALCQEGVQAFIAHCNGDYAGNVVGFPPCPIMQKELRLHEMEIDMDGLIYLFNIVAMPQFQGQGVGKQLLMRFLELSHAAGFSRVGGHFRGNGSLSNFARYGGETLATFDNWFDTGESYCYCELHLAKALQIA